VEAVGMLRGADYDVVIVGGSASVFRPVHNDDAAPVTRLGYVDDADLKALFRDAACFVFPSLYEGYGLPPVEAMTLGCPVLASNLPSVREACGTAALYFRPTKPAEFGELLTYVMQDGTLRDAMRQRGYAHVQRYSWRDTAARLLGEISPCLPQR